MENLVIIKTIKTIKAMSYALLMPIFTFTGLSKEIVTILAILIALDLFTAIIRELTVTGGRFLSRTLWVGIASKGLLILIPIVLALVGKGIGMNLKWLAELSLSALIVAESYSILGNIIQTRNNDKTIDEQDAVTSVIKSLESFISTILTTVLSRLGTKK
jgi:hypothetical protein